MSDTYISFADELGFLGAICLEGDLDPIDAIAQTHRMGINPGGEALIVSVPTMFLPRNRLLSEDELIHSGLCRRLHES